MRLFVSLRLPPAVRDHLAGALAGLRLTEPSRWHVTLAFLGEQPGADAVEQTLAGVLTGHRPLSLRVRGGGTFPGVLWAGLDGDVAGLHRLADDVAQSCRAAGVDLDRRRYRPHVTVARRPRDARVLDCYTGPTWRADEVELVRSTLGATVRHDVLRRFALGPAAP